MSAEATSAPSGRSVCERVKKLNSPTREWGAKVHTASRADATMRTVNHTKTPPIVGVPDFFLCNLDAIGAEDALRIVLPSLKRYNTCVNSGVHAMATTNVSAESTMRRTSCA